MMLLTPTERNPNERIRDKGTSGEISDEFTIESRTANALKVRHVATGHRFTFRVSRPQIRPRFLKRDYSPGQATKRAVREELEKAAHAFAERKARKAGLID